MTPDASSSRRTVPAIRCFAAAALLVLAALASSRTAAQGATAVDGVERLRVDGTQRSYRLHVPAAGSAPRPLLLSFHDAGEDAARHAALTRWAALADRAGFIVVQPDAHQDRWRAASRSDADVRMVEQLIAALAKRGVAIDPQRIYAAGLGSGARMALRLACALPARIAAVGLVATEPTAWGEPPCEGRRAALITFDASAEAAAQSRARDYVRNWAIEPNCRLAARGQIVVDAGGAQAERWDCGARPAVLYTLPPKSARWPAGAPDAVDASAAMWNFFSGVRR